MQSQKRAKNLYLLSPGYRRWLPSEAAEVLVECAGLAAEDRRRHDVRTFVRSAETDAETRTVTPLDSDSDVLTLPVPKVHGRGEIIVAVEDRRTKEPAVDGRWSFVALSKEEQAATTYFDSRGICFVGGEARFPILWRPGTAKFDRESLRRVRAAGFDGLVDGRTSASTAEMLAAAGAAQEAGLSLVLCPLDQKADEASAVSRVRELRNAAAVFAWLLPASTLRAGGAGLALYRVIRRTDPTRPVLLDGAEAADLGRLEGFEDAILWNAPAGTSEALSAIRRRGWPLFWKIDPSSAKAAVHDQLLRGLSQRASAVVVAGADAVPGEPWALKLAKEMQSLRRLLIRGTPLRSTNDVLGVGPWIRHFEEESLVVAKNDEAVARTIVIELPVGPAKWIDLATGASCKVDSAGGRPTMSVSIAPHSVAGFTNALDVVAGSDRAR